MLSYKIVTSENDAFSVSFLSFAFFTCHSGLTFCSRLPSSPWLITSFLQPHSFLSFFYNFPHSLFLISLISASCPSYKRVSSCLPSPLSHSLLSLLISTLSSSLLFSSHSVWFSIFLTEMSFCTWTSVFFYSDSRSLLSSLYHFTFCPSSPISSGFRLLMQTPDCFQLVHYFACNELFIDWMWCVGASRPPV